MFKHELFVLLSIRCSLHRPPCKCFLISFELNLYCCLGLDPSQLGHPVNGLNRPCLFSKKMFQERFQYSPKTLIHFFKLII